jgi:hypothetical protein
MLTYRVRFSRCGLDSARLKCKASCAEKIEPNRFYPEFGGIRIEYATFWRLCTGFQLIPVFLNFVFVLFLTFIVSVD